MLRSLLLFVPLGAVLVGAVQSVYASPAAHGPRMGTPTRISRKAFEGYYDGHEDTYLNTDVSDKAEAAAMHINYAPVLKSVPLASAPEIYLVEGRAAAGQLAIFGSEPGEPSYSPVWKETILTWKPDATPVLIRSDTQIDRLEGNGVLSERATSIRLNCPIVRVGKGSSEGGRTYQARRTRAVLSAGNEPGPAQFVRGVGNQWFPLRPGTTYVYRGMREGKATRDVVTVSDRTKMIARVRATAVRDRLYVAGRLAERTTDWYAQDRAGNVWYFGEATAELNAKGKVTSTEGSWRSGVAGGRPGIIMPAHPRIGQSFRQENYKVHAEDYFAVLSLSDSVRTPVASSRRALLTKEWSPLEPGVIDHKIYVRGIGMVKEETVKGAVERGVLVAVRR